MSVQSRNRILSLTAAVALFATTLAAGYPSSRTETRMVFDRATTNMLLYGGESPNDSGTKQTYSLADTWQWNGIRWTQLFPAHSPGPRSSYAFAYDSIRNRALLFGGKNGKAQFNDTWSFQNGDWTQIDTPNSPTIRILPGGAFDSVRDRFVVFGGTQTSDDLKTITTLSDTWEFDGTTWVQRATTGPTVIKPILVYDEARNEILMMGIDTDSSTLMYRYKPADATWEKITPATKPTCANESAMTYMSTTQTVLLTGGVCTTSTIVEESYTWDGTNWTLLAPTSHSGNAFGQALAFDPVRGLALQFGGTEAFSVPQNRTFIFADNTWRQFTDPFTPGPRSLFMLRGDTANNAMWLFGGFNESEAFGDAWKFQNGAWTKLSVDGGPNAACATPTGAFDTDRNKLVVVCSDSTTYEWDGGAWKKFDIDEKKLPTGRRFASMVYDANIKKTVLFGGFNDPNYLSQTWTWDGTTWTRVKNKVPPARALTTMWFDPIKNRTLIYGGIGREDPNDRIQRFGDMWSFDGSGWAEVKPATTPGTRYGAQAAVEPSTKKTVLFGGLRLDMNGTLQVQVYANDTWEWDGTTWKQITTTNAPPARENGFFDYDPSRGALTLFGGYSGIYLSDVWTFKNGVWTMSVDPPLPRRRTTGH